MIDHGDAPEVDDDCERDDGRVSFRGTYQSVPIRRMPIGWRRNFNRTPALLGGSQLLLVENCRQERSACSEGATGRS